MSIGQDFSSFAGLPTFVARLLAATCAALLAALMARLLTVGLMRLSLGLRSVAAAEPARAHGVGVRHADDVLQQPACRRWRWLSKRAVVALRR
jgi:hypothetical protein